MVVIAKSEATQQSRLVLSEFWIASRSMSSGATLRRLVAIRRFATTKRKTGWLYRPPGQASLAAASRDPVVSGRGHPTESFGSKVASPHARRDDILRDHNNELQDHNNEQ